MPYCVQNANNTNKPCPQTVEELVTLISAIASDPNTIDLQVSGYTEELVKEIASRYGVNYFTFEEAKSLNPFTILYINRDGEVMKFGIEHKSTITIYARRPIHHHHQ